MEGLTISASEVQEHQEKWGRAVANKDIDTLMNLYHPQGILNPTLSPIVRRNATDIRSYFLGEKFNDPGFLKNKIVSVRFTNSQPRIHGAIAIDSGDYEFVQESGDKVLAQYTFVWQKTSDGSCVILSQHSSLNNY